MKSKIISLLLAISMTFGVIVSAAPTETQVQFKDVSETAYYYEEVVWGVENGIVNGFSEDKFEPTLSCTRGQIATFIWRAEGKQKAENAKVTFKDVSKTSYYYDAIAWAVEEGIISGYSAKSFGPDDTCTRAQLATILYRLADNSKTEDQILKFRDVPSGAYYYDAVAWAVEEGIVNGYTNTKFGPDDKALRCDTVRILYGFYHLNSKDEVMPEITPEVTPEVTPEITPEITPEVTPEITPEITPEVTPEVTPEITPEVTPEITPEVKPDKNPDKEPEKESEVDKAFPWNEEKAAEVIELAKTYLYKAGLFKYNAGYGAFNNTYIDKESGKYIIDCSTFIGLVLRGIPYEESRYITDNIWNNMARTDLYTWADSGLDRDHVRWAYEYAEYYEGLERTFDDISSAKPADIVFHIKKDAITGEESVWHVSMVYEVAEDGKITCIHSLYGKSNVGVWTYKLTDSTIEKYGRVLLARPDYSLEHEEDAVEIEYETHFWAMPNDKDNNMSR